MKKQKYTPPPPEPATVATVAALSAMDGAAFTASDAGLPRQAEPPKRRMTHEEARLMPLPARYRTRYFNGGN